MADLRTQKQKEKANNGLTKQFIIELEKSYKHFEKIRAKNEWKKFTEERNMAGYITRPSWEQIEKAIEQVRWAKWEEKGSRKRKMEED